ncbi:thiol-disulfide oxidoreductase DCC family protein [uncultured Draconibacterium sp.]|uniref:thiol-disulfide oxidoreductase DCC family protein n=1 Tax=uncultured Draconibacterium sp. TaxID=1573823 RepID=UPI003216C047
MNKHHPVVLFDGICNLCNGTVSFILKKDKKNQFRFLAIQSKEGKTMLEKYPLPFGTDSVILIYKGRAFIESDAALEIVKLLSAPWKWFVIFECVPKKWRDKMYRWIAKNRYSWFGKKDSCDLGDE